MEQNETKIKIDKKYYKYLQKKPESERDYYMDRVHCTVSF